MRERNGTAYARREAACLSSLAVALAVLAPSAAFAATSPYVIAPRCEANRAVKDDLKCSTYTTQARCEASTSCWWRDPTDQNNLANHTTNDWTGLVRTVYAGPELTVLAWSSHAATNVVMLVAGGRYLFVGTGGYSDAAAAARYQLDAALPAGGKIADMNPLGIVYTDAHPTSFGGAHHLLTISYAPRVAHFRFMEMLGAGSLENELETCSPAPCAGPRWARTLDLMGRALSWGSNGFLGLGSGYAYAYSPDPELGEAADLPSILINESTTLYLGSGAVPVELRPSSLTDASLLVWLPNQKILIAGKPLGDFFPDVAPPDGRNLSLPTVANAIDSMMSLAPDYLVELHGLPPVQADPAGVSARLANNRDVLRYVVDVTVQGLKQGKHIDDIAASLELSPELAVTAARQYTTTVASAARAVYASLFGQFDGDPAHLNRASRVEQAARLVDIAGGPRAALSRAIQYSSEHTRAGLQAALELTSALRIAAPSAQVTTVHVQVLQMLAWTDPSAYNRNYYLSQAQKAASGL